MPEIALPKPLTLREYIATHIAAGFAASEGDGFYKPDYLADRAVTAADALIARLNQGENE